MSRQATFYHAGCPVCVDAETQFAQALNPQDYSVEVVSLNPQDYSVEVVHLGETPDRIAEAEAAGVASVPAFVVDGKPYHINFGASIADLK